MKAGLTIPGSRLGMLDHILVAWCSGFGDEVWRFRLYGSQVEGCRFRFHGSGLRVQRVQDLHFSGIGVQL